MTHNELFEELLSKSEKNYDVLKRLKRANEERAAVAPELAERDAQSEFTVARALVEEIVELALKYRIAHELA